MTTDLGERRKGRVLSFFLVAGALSAIAAVTTAIESRSLRGDAASGAVLPNLEAAVADARRIVVTSSEASYQIERIQRGDADVWVMRDRGDYVVANARVEQLINGLEAFRYTRRMTSDPAKYERLGVGDPREGGGGVLVQVEGGRGALLVNLILGIEPGGTYVRRPDEAQAFAAVGALPPLRDPAAWLDLRPLLLAAERLARVEIVPAEGRAYILARDSAEAPWRIATPSLAPISESVVAAAAERLTGVEPIDVQTAPAIQGAPRARVRATTFDGVIIDAEIVPNGEAMWLKLVARPQAPEQDAAALEINNRSSAWAYGLSREDVEELAPPLSSLIGTAPVNR